MTGKIFSVVTPILPFCAIIICFNFKFTILILCFCVCHLQKACQRVIKCFLMYLKCFIYDFLAQIISYKIWLLCFFNYLCNQFNEKLLKQHNHDATISI